MQKDIAEKPTVGAERPGDGSAQENGPAGDDFLLTENDEEMKEKMAELMGDFQETEVSTPEKSGGSEPPSPTTATKLEEPDFIAKSVDKLLALEALNSKDWNAVHTSEHIKVLKMKDESSPVVLIKVYVTLPDVPADKVFKLIYDLDLRKEWDNLLSNMKIFGPVNENVDHMYSLYKAPIGVSNRDFCQRRLKVLNYKEIPYIIQFESVDHKDCPPVKSVVRAHTSISGYIIRPSKTLKNSTEMTILTQTDIKGKLPKALVNMMAAKAPTSWCKNFKKNAERLIKAGKV